MTYLIKEALLDNSRFSFVKEEGDYFVLESTVSDLFVSVKWANIEVVESPRFGNYKYKIFKD